MQVDLCLAYSHTMIRKRNGSEFFLTYEIEFALFLAMLENSVLPSSTTKTPNGGWKGRYATKNVKSKRNDE